MGKVRFVTEEFFRKKHIIRIIPLDTLKAFGMSLGLNTVILMVSKFTRIRLEWMDG